jgi:hypothetical protein
MMTLIFPVLFLLLSLSVEIACAQQSSTRGPEQRLTPFCNENPWIGHIKDNIVMVRYWTPKFKKLHESIPILSPKEEDWLKSEMTHDDSNRRTRAESSTEYHLVEVKRWAGVLLFTISNAEKSTDKLSLLAYELSDPFMSDRLKILIDRNVIAPSALPDDWTIFGLSAQSLDRTRMHLVRFLSGCTIPNAIFNKVK